MSNYQQPYDKTKLLYKKGNKTNNADKNLKVESR